MPKNNNPKSNGIEIITPITVTKISKRQLVLTSYKGRVTRRSLYSMLSRTTNKYKNIYITKKLYQ